MRRAAWVVILGLVGLGLGWWPLLRWASPQLAVDAALLRHPAGGVRPTRRGADPWGRTWCWRRSEELTGRPGVGSLAFQRSYRMGRAAVVERTYVYSTGPNGRDEAGAGDDLFVEPCLGSGLSLPLAWGHEVSLVLAGCVAWALGWMLPPRHARVAVELFRAAGATAVPLAVVAWATWRWSAVLQAPSGWAPLVPLWVSLVLTAAAALYLGALGVRLTRPLAGATGPPR